jgi:hypothetical protein
MWNEKFMFVVVEPFEEHLVVTASAGNPFDKMPPKH